MQTKIKDGNKVFPKKLDIEELNLLVYKVYKELYILNSFSSTQSGLLHCPTVKLGGKKQVLPSLLPKLLLNEKFTFHISISSEQ